MLDKCNVDWTCISFISNFSSLMHSYVLCIIKIILVMWDRLEWWRINLFHSNVVCCLGLGRGVMCPDVCLDKSGYFPTMVMRDA